MSLWKRTHGGKLWRWSYRYEGKEKLMSLGRYSDVSLSKARERHRDERALLASGIDSPSISVRRCASLIKRRRETG